MRCRSVNTSEQQAFEEWLETNNIRRLYAFHQNGNRGALVSRFVGLQNNAPVFIQLPKPELQKQFAEEYNMRRFLLAHGVSTPAVLQTDSRTGAAVEAYQGTLDLSGDIVVEQDYNGPMTLYILLKQDVRNTETVYTNMEQAHQLLTCCRQTLAQYFTKAKTKPQNSYLYFEEVYQSVKEFLKPAEQAHIAFSMELLRRSVDYEIIKGDSGAGNFLLERETDTLYLIDFEEAGMGYRYQDEVRLLFTSGLCLPKETVFLLAEQWGLLKTPVAVAQMVLLCALRWMQAEQAKHMDRAREYATVFQTLKQLLNQPGETVDFTNENESSLYHKN